MRFGQYGQRDTYGFGADAPPAQPKRQLIGEQFYYNTLHPSTSTLAQNASDTQTINIQADADFIIVKQSRDVRDTNQALQANPSALVVLTDLGSNRQMMDIATPLENIFGTGQFPYILPQAKRISANSSFQVVVTNLSSTASIFRLTFSGMKQYIFKPEA